MWRRKPEDRSPAGWRGHAFSSVREHSSITSVARGLLFDGERGGGGGGGRKSIHPTLRSRGEGTKNAVIRTIRKRLDLSLQPSGVNTSVIRRIILPLIVPASVYSIFRAVEDRKEEGRGGGQGRQGFLVNAGASALTGRFPSTLKLLLNR